MPPSSRTTTYAGIVTRAVAFAMDVAIVYAILFLIGVVVALIIGAFSSFNLDVDVRDDPRCGRRVDPGVQRSTARRSGR